MEGQDGEPNQQSDVWSRSLHVLMISAHITTSAHTDTWLHSSVFCSPPNSLDEPSANTYGAAYYAQS
jgi:hypothetical protein